MHTAKLHTSQLQKLVASACNKTHNCKQQSTIHTTTDGGQNFTSDHCTTKLKINGCERSHCEQSLNHNHIGCKSAPIVKRAQQALGHSLQSVADDLAIFSVFHDKRKIQSLLTKKCVGSVKNLDKCIGPFISASSMEDIKW